MENQKETRYPKEVVLVPFPVQGHTSPMLQLGTLLHSLGFSITVAHARINSPHPSTHPEFDFQPISEDLADRDTSFNGLFSVIMTLNTDCGEPLRECLVRLTEDRGPVACVVYDSLMYFADEVANQMKIPSMVLQTCNAAYILPCQLLPQLKAEGYLPSESEDPSWEDLVPKLHPLRFKDLPFPKFDTPTLQVLMTLCDVRTSSAIIWNTTDHLEHPFLCRLRQHYKVPIFPLGPLQKMAPSSSTSFLKEEYDCLTWLEKQAPKSVIYVSFGSIATVEPNELSEVAWGLVNSGLPFLLVVRPGLVNGSEWIEHLPESFKEFVGERGCIVKWAPQKEVLAHEAVGGFWSHCGWNSSLESISEGVPMICRPCFGDQRVNARYLTHVWRVGLELEDKLERGAIERVLRRLMTGKEGEEIRRRAMDMKQNIEEVVQKGGSSYNSLIELADPAGDHLVPKLYPLRFKDLPILKFNTPTLQLLTTLSDIRTSSAVIWNTIDHLEHPSLCRLRQHYKVPIFPLGPLQKMAPSSSASFLKEDYDCLTWLEKQAPKSVIYVSFGSIAMVEPNELSEVAWSLANSGQPFLWVVRPGLVEGSERIEHLPEGFKETVGERGCIVKWAPQKEVLAHEAVGGFWSHCGWNSSLESISEGVPMICRPCFGDQRVNARYLTHVWRVGLELENKLERGAIESAVRRLMIGKEGKEIRRKVLDMKQNIEEIVQKGGSSYNTLIELADFISDFHKTGQY